MYLDMAKYLLLLLLIVLISGAVFYTLLKRYGLPGMVKGALGGMGVFGKGLLVLFSAGASAPDEDEEEDRLMGPFIFDADAHGVGSGHKDHNGNLYL